MSVPVVLLTDRLTGQLQSCLQPAMQFSFRWGRGSKPTIVRLTRKSSPQLQNVSSRHRAVISECVYVCLCVCVQSTAKWHKDTVLSDGNDGNHGDCFGAYILWGPRSSLWFLLSYKWLLMVFEIIWGLIYSVIISEVSSPDEIKNSKWKSAIFYDSYIQRDKTCSGHRPDSSSDSDKSI